MDSQDNLMLKVVGSGVSTNYPIVVNNKLTRSILFSFKESDFAELTNYIADSDVYVEDIENGKETKLSFGEKAVLNDRNHPYPALEYRLRIFNKNTRTANLYLYRIKPLASTNDNQYKIMVSSVARFDESFLYDQDAKFLNSNRIYKSGYKNLFTLTAILLNNSNLINNSINSISSNPALKDKRIVVETYSQKKQSSRSIIKNIRAVKPDVYYSSKVIQYSDFGLNRYMVYMLLFSKTRLKDTETIVINEVKNLNERLNRIVSNSNPANRSKNASYQIGLCEKRIKQLERFRVLSSSIILNIERLLRTDAFKDIAPSSKRDTLIVHNPLYLNIERQLYLPLFQGFSFVFANIYGSILSAPIKTTSKLFEAYCLLSIETAILELGFVDVSNEIDYDHVRKTYSNGDYLFELMYEINAKDVSVTNKGDVFFVHKDARHITPDFYLVLKKKDVPIAFLVIDAKCKKVSTLQKSIETGEYEENVRDYLSMRYSTNENPFISSKIVDSLWFILPDDYSDAEYEKYNKLEYKYNKLAIDGEESKFISSFYDYFSIYLD